jgi:hypothetical protein
MKFTEFLSESSGDLRIKVWDIDGNAQGLKIYKIGHNDTVITSIKGDIYYATGKTGVDNKSKKPTKEFETDSKMGTVKKLSMSDDKKHLKHMKVD